MKENYFALIGRCEGQAETRSGANQAFFVQKRFELRSAIATNTVFVGHPDIVEVQAGDLDRFLETFKSLLNPNISMRGYGFLKAGLRVKPQFGAERIKSLVEIGGNILLNIKPSS